MYQAPRGTQDILPADRPYWRYVTEEMHEVAALFGLQQIDTPIFEETGLYVRGVGEGTDIVDKEMYSFEDKGGAEHHPAPRVDRGRHARVHRARHARLAAAGQALLDGPDLPLRAAPGRPFPPASPVQRGDARRARPRGRPRGHVGCLDPAHPARLPGPELPAQLDRLPEVPPGLPPGPDGLLQAVRGPAERDGPPAAADQPAAPARL